MLKRTMDFGPGPWRITFFSNWSMALVALPLLLLPAGTDGSAAWHLPIWPAITFFGGQIFTFLALFRGDVLVATLLMGTKFLFVAILTILILQQPVPLAWWIAAFLSTAALALLGGGKSTLKGKLWPTVIYALTSSLLFAVTDLMTQEWAGAWGVTRFFPAMLGLVAIYSLGFIPFFRESFFVIDRRAWSWLGFGGLILGIQALGMGIALGLFKNATAMNIAYSSRGIWSVVLVWAIGHWFTNEEHLLSRRVLAARLLGAGMLLIAVALVALA